MYCSNCGKMIAPGAKFCGSCGMKVVENHSESDKGLVERARKKDQEAIALLYEQNYVYVLFSIRTIIKEDDTAMDLMQDTFLKAFQHLDQLKDDANFAPWIKRIAINTAKDYTRKKKPTLFTDMTGEDDEDSGSFEELIPDDRSFAMPDEVMDQEETVRLMGEILYALPEDQRIIISMFYYDEMSLKDIAETLEIPVNTVKTRLSRGRKNIKKRVQELEKKGTTLRGLAPIPFLLFLFKNMDAQASQIVPSETAKAAILASVSETAGTAAGTAAQTAAAAQTSAASAAAETAGNAAAAAAGETAGSAVTAAASGSGASAAGAAAAATGKAAGGFALKAAAVAAAAAIGAGGVAFVATQQSGDGEEVAVQEESEDVEEEDVYEPEEETEIAESVEIVEEMEEVEEETEDWVCEMNTAVTVDEAVLWDADGVTVTVTDLEFEGEYAYLHLSVENQGEGSVSIYDAEFGDELTTNTYVGTVNQFMCSVEMPGLVLSSGESEEFSISYYLPDLLFCGITDIAQLSFPLDYCNSETYASSYVDLCVYTSAAETAGENIDPFSRSLLSESSQENLGYSVLAYSEEDMEVSEGIEVHSYALIRKEGRWVLLAEVVNNGEEGRTVTSREFQVNGLLIDSQYFSSLAGYGSYIDAGCTCIVQRDISDAFCDSLGVGDLADISFSLDYVCDIGFDLYDDSQICVEGLTVYDEDGFHLTAAPLYEDDDFYVLPFYLEYDGDAIPLVGSYKAYGNYAVVNGTTISSDYYMDDSTVREGMVSFAPLYIYRYLSLLTGITDVSDITEVQFILEVTRGTGDATDEYDVDLNDSSYYLLTVQYEGQQPVSSRYEPFDYDALFD